MPQPTGDGCAIAMLDTTSGGQPRQLADLPSSLRCRAPFRSETALPEANSFPSRLPTVLLHSDGLCRTLLGGPVAGVTSVKDQRPDRRSFWPGLTRRTVVSTLIQSPESRRYGCDPSINAWGPRRYQARHKAYRGVVWASVTHRHGEPCRTRCQISKEKPWPRASGPSSRITGAEPACTASVCGCGPGLAGPSCPVGVARAAAR